MKSRLALLARLHSTPFEANQLNKFQRSQLHCAKPCGDKIGKCAVQQHIAWHANMCMYQDMKYWGLDIYAACPVSYNSNNGYNGTQSISHAAKACACKQGQAYTIYQRAWHATYMPIYCNRVLCFPMPRLARALGMGPGQLIAYLYGQ